MISDDIKALVLSCVDSIGRFSKFKFNKFKTSEIDELMLNLQADPIQLFYLVKLNYTEIPKCPACGKLVYEFWKREYCSITCGLKSEQKKERCKHTCLQRYGKSNVSQVDFINNRKIETCRNNYGTDYPMQSLIVQNKSKETCLSNYNVEHPAQSDIIKRRTEQTNLKRYGVKYVSQNYDIRQKQLKTCFENNGAYYNLSLPCVRDKIKETCNNLYGVDYPSQNKDIINKTKTKLKINYYNTFLEKIASKNISYLGTKDSYINYDEERMYKCNICNSVFYTDKTNPASIFCRTCYDNYKSNKEFIVYKFVSNFIPEDDIIRNTRTVISDDNQKYELDIYIPSKNLAIEFNGIYWHSDIFKDKYYHQNKFLACYEKGIRLIQINEFDWNTNRSIVESIIKDALDVHEHQIDANDCTVNEIDERTYMCFLFENSLQLLEEKDKYYGMFYKDRLVCVFGLKDGIATYAYDLSYKINNLYEVVRTLDNVKGLKFNVDYECVINYCSITEQPKQYYYTLNDYSIKNIYGSNCVFNCGAFIDFFNGETL